MVSLNNFEETEKQELIVQHGFNEEKSNGDHEVFNFCAKPHPAVSVLACARHFFPFCAAWNVFQKSSDPRFELLTPIFFWKSAKSLHLNFIFVKSCSSILSN